MLRLEHIGIAVDDANAMTQILSDVLGRTPYKAESVLSEGVRTLFLDAGGAKLELLEATSEESPIAGFLRKRGAGMHHLAFEVADLDGEISRLGDLGYEVLGNARTGADGKRIVFLHPRDTGRVLIELCQQAGFASATPEDGPSPETVVHVADSTCSGALGHALGRHYRVVGSVSHGSAAAVSVMGSSESPHILLRDCDAGDLDVWITSDRSPREKRAAESSDEPGSTSIPAYLWRGLPDPWGFMADLLAAHIKSGRSTPERVP